MGALSDLAESRALISMLGKELASGYSDPLALLQFVLFSEPKPIGHPIHIHSARILQAFTIIPASVLTRVFFGHGSV